MIKKLLKKNFVLTILLTLFIITLNAPISVLAVDTPVSSQLTIFHTNDMHGRLLDAYNNAKPPVLTQIGSDYVASIKKSVPNSLLIDAGDATQGLPFATVSKGADVIKLMNAAGYDGMALGNHEFDYGKDQAISNAELASFPIISANTMNNGKPFLAGINGNNGEDFVKTVNGIKVGFFGITTQETVYKTSPSSLSGITFEDPIKVSKDEVSKLKAEGASVIVGIMHMGNDSSSSPISEDIAKAVNGINVIIDGHSHSVENKIVNNTLIAQTGCYSANIGRIDISISGSGNVTATENLISAAAATTAYTPDSTVKNLASQIKASQDPIFSQIVGRTNTPLWGGTVDGQSITRLVETNMGDLIADAMVYGGKLQIASTEYAALPVIALENGGGVRDSIPAGNISQGQITTVLPFGNILSLKEVTPALLYQVLENGVSKISVKDSTSGIISGWDGRFPQVSGMRFEYNPQNPASSRISKIVLLNPDGSDKQTLDRNDTDTKIVIVSNEFEVGGGDGYTMLGSLKNIGEGNALDVVTADYIKKLTSENDGAFSYPQYQGRIKISSNFTYNPYSAGITIKNGSNIVSANTAVTYAIDNGNSIQSVIGDNGVLNIENLPSGPHTVSILCTNSAADCYINNIIGLNTPATVAANLISIDSTIPKETSDLIEALPANISLMDKDAVAKARASYSKLTLAQKSLVTNYSKLTDAEDTLARLASSNQPSTTNNSNSTNSTNNSKDSSTVGTTSQTLPQTGSMLDYEALISIGILLILGGSFVFIRDKKQQY